MTASFRVCLRPIRYCNLIGALKNPFKALEWKTPFQSIFDAWKSNPSAFRINPRRLIPGSYIQKSAPAPPRNVLPPLVM